MSRDPRRNLRSLSIREQVDDAALFEIADHRAVALAALPRKIVNADDADWSARQASPAA